jgi:excisionase family DNA binding protein
MPEENKPSPRFLTIDKVATELNIGQPLVRGLLKSGELRGFQLGGRRYLGQLVGMQRSLPVFWGQTS